MKDLKQELRKVVESSKKARAVLPESVRRQEKTAQKAQEVSRQIRAEREK